MVQPKKTKRRIWSEFCDFKKKKKELSAVLVGHLTQIITEARLKIDIR